MGGGLGVLLAAGIVPGMQRYLPPALDFTRSYCIWTGPALDARCFWLCSQLAAGATPAFIVSPYSSAGSSAQRLATDQRIT